jgi:DNA repair photolyase
MATADSSNFGTREWSVKTVNCCDGCSHNCRYCYARAMAVRFKRRTMEDWHLERIRPHDLAKRHKNYGGTVMFPSSHDRDNLDREDESHRANEEGRYT